MNLDRMQPKSKTERAKSISVPQSIDIPPTVRVTGKAGKSYVLVQVGEVTDL